MWDFLGSTDAVTVGESIEIALTEFIVKFWIVLAIVYGLILTVRWKLFEKAGEPGWTALIPIYNRYMLFKLFWSSSAFGVRILLITGAGYLYQSQLQRLTVGSLFNPNTYMNILIAALPLCIAGLMKVVLLYRISVAFGHGLGMALGLIFIPVICFPILVWGDSACSANPGWERRRTNSSDSPSHREKKQVVIDKKKVTVIAVAASIVVIVAGVGIIADALVRKHREDVEQQKIEEAQTLNYELENWMFYSNTPVEQFEEKFGEYTDSEEKKAFWESKKHYTYVWEEIPLVNDVPGQLTVKYHGDTLENVKWIYQSEYNFAEAKENLEKALEKLYTSGGEEEKTPLMDENYREREYTFENSGLQYSFVFRIYDDLTTIELEFEPLYEYKE